MRLATIITAQRLRNALLIVFVASLLGGMMLPVYTDEIGWRLQERAALDGVDKLYSDICGPNTLAVPPSFMWPRSKRQPNYAESADRSISADYWSMT